MANISLEDLYARMSEARLIELTDDDQAGEINTEVTDAVIDEASGLVNGYCRAKYSEAMPFSTVPGIVKKLTIDIAEYLLYARREAVSEAIEKRHEMAMQQCRDIAAGRLKLEVLSGSQASENTVSASNLTADDLKFGGKTGPKGYFT